MNYVLSPTLFKHDKFILTETLKRVRTTLLPHYHTVTIWKLVRFNKQKVINHKHNFTCKTKMTRLKRGMRFIINETIKADCAHFIQNNLCPGDTLHKAQTIQIINFLLIKDDT